MRSGDGHPHHGKSVWATLAVARKLYVLFSRISPGLMQYTVVDGDETGDSPLLLRRGRKTKNPQSLAVKGFSDGVPGRIRTCDAGIRSPALYPLSYGDPFKAHGRGGGIRTPDPLLPKQVRYQAALRPGRRHQ